MKKPVKNDAFKWWAEKIKSGNHVVSSSEIPGQRQREILVKEKSKRFFPDMPIGRFEGNPLFWFWTET